MLVTKVTLQEYSAMGLENVVRLARFISFPGNFVAYFERVFSTG
jgi:hypothetical protein